MTNKVLLKRTSSASLEQIATDVSSSVTIDSYKILKSLDIIIFDGDDQDRLFTEISALELGSVSKDHNNFEYHATRSTYVPGTNSGNRYWHLDAISRLDYDDSNPNVGLFSTRSDGEDVDIYVIDSGVQGASRPTGSGAALHPEFFHPDWTDLDNTTHQGYYRVYSLPTTLFDPGTTNGNEPQTVGSSTTKGHGTYCAMMAAGRYSGVASKAKIYALRVSNDAGDILNSKMLEAFDAVYRHNDPNDSAFKGNDLDGGTRPRSSVVNVSIGINSPTPEFPFFGRNENYVGQTRNFTVGNNGSSDYTFTGTDATTTHTNANDPTLTVTKGDTLVMNLSASGHPFLVNDANGAFAGATTTSGNNQTGEVTIDTSQISGTSGTLTYVCQFHSAMTGSIVVQEANLASSNWDEMYGDAEARISALSRVTLCRSAGNGMTWEDSGDVYRDYGPKNTKITYGARDAGYQSFLDPEISITNKSNETYGATDKLTVGATRIASNRQTFASFTNYGEAVTCYAPGQGIYCPSYDWTIDTPTSATDYSGSSHATISGTSFSTPLLAGMIAVWRDVYDGATGATGQERVEENAEKKLSFVDITASTPTQVGFQNTVRTSAGAATTYFMTTEADDTAKRAPLSTTNGSNNVVLSLHDALYTALNPQQGDIFEFEFPRVEDPGTRNATTLVADERKKDTFNLGEVVKYEVTVNNNVFELARVQNGVAGTPSAQPVIALEQGVVYRFYQTDTSNLTHPFDISPTSDGTHAGGSAFINHMIGIDLNPKHCMRYFVAGQGEVERTAYDAAVGGGVECFIEFIDPRGDTHPDVPDSMFPVGTSLYYYCMNHPSMGAELTTASTVTEATIGGISLADFCSKWRTVTATDAVSKTITFTADTNATGTEQGGGGMFNKADNDTGTDGRPRWPMRFTKIEGTFFENDAIYNWINNYSNVVRSGTSPDGNAYAAGELWAQLETEEYGGGVQIKSFPVPKSRVPKEYIDRDTSVYGPDALYTLRLSGNRWGSGPQSNGRTEGAGDPDSLVRMYEPVSTGVTSVVYDGGQGVFFPFIDLNATYSITPALSGAGYANGSSVSSTISTVITTFAGEDPEPFMTKEYELVDSPVVLDTEYNNGAITNVVGDGSNFFKREVTTNGVRIMGAGTVGGQTAVPDAWLEKVARMIELFTDVNGTGINETSQRNLIKTLSGDAGTYHAGFPTIQRVARGSGSEYTPNFLTDQGIIDWNLTNLYNTTVQNDMVWYLNSSGVGYGDGDTDAQEVIEHVFHTLHMHGLPADTIKLYEQISSDWQSGDLYAAMEEAYDAGKWDPSGYNSPSNAWKTNAEAFEVAAKEYLYLLNFCMFEYAELWDGGSLAPEWTDDMRTQAGIQTNNPLGYAFHNTYIAPAISKPSLATIRSIFQDGNTPAQDDPSLAGASGYVVDSSSPFTLSGSVYTITGSGLSFDASTGVLSGTTTSSANDATYAIRVKEKVSQGTADFSWTNSGTNNATISIDTQPTAAVGDGSYPVDSGTTTFTVVASASDSGSLNYAWQYATTQAEVNNNQWTAVPSTGVFIGASGANTATLTIPDSTAISGYFFTCLVSAAAGNASPVRTQTRDFTATVTLTSNVWFTEATQYATQLGNGGSKVEVQATFSDGATPTLALTYASQDGTETLITNSPYALVATGSNGSNGFPEYDIRLGKATLTGGTSSDSGETFQVTINHPSGFVSTTIPPTTSAAITVNDAYSVGTDLSATGSVNQDTAYTLTATFSNLASGSGVANPTIIWAYNDGNGLSYINGTEPWYTSGIGTGTLSFTPTLSMSGWSFLAYAYHDFTGTSGTADSDNLLPYSAIETTEHLLTVIQTQSGPAIRIVKPAGVSADNSLSTTNSTFSTSEYLLTITSDMLPDPATHGPHPNSSNPNTTSAQNLNHTIRYRGGTNSPSLTPWSLGTLGLAANGVALFNPSAGTGALPGSTDAPPPGFEYNAVHNEAYYGVDTAGGHPESNGEYHYHSGKFLFSGDWSSVAQANPYYGATNYNNDNLRHADGHSKIIGWAFDGHPIYGPWGYTNANDNTSSPTRMTSSFIQLNTDTHRPVGFKYTDTITVNGQSVTLTAGSFLQDFTYSPGSGTLDSSNGRYGVTPEYPNGTYAYFITVDSSNVPVYPYIFGTSLRQAYYQPDSAFVPSDPGGANTNGPSNGGFNPNNIWVKGMTVLAKTGGDNGREITVDNLTPGSGAHTYQWQKSSDNGQNWSDIAASEIGFSGETNTTLTIKDNSSAVDDLLIRLKLTDAGSAVSYSEFIPLQYVGSTLSISAQPADATIISGQTATFSVTAASTDDVTLTYQWEESSDNGSTWTTMTGETNATLSLSGIQTPAANTGYQYRVQVSSTSATNAPLTSNVAILTVSQGSITVDTQPTSQTVNEGSDATFSVGISTNSGLAITYLWEKSDDQGTTWTTVAGETSSSLTVSGTVYADDNDDYYRVTGSIPGLGSIVANAVILTVQRTLAIDTQPTDQTVYDTQNVTFSVATTVSSGTATYQWEESTDSGTTWSAVSGAVNNSYTISNVATSASGNQYRVIVSLVGSAGDVTSNAATLTVNARPTLAIVSQPQDQTRYQPDTATFTVTANASDASVVTYQWEKSDDSGTTWTPLTGETTNSYTTPATVTANDNGDQYRVIISHPAATNSPITSDVATLTVVTPLITFTLQPQSISTTAGVPVTFTANASVTSSRTINYLWQVSSDQGATWTDIPGSISNNLSVTGDASNNGYYYRLKANSEGAAVAYSNSAILTLQFIANPSISASGFVDPITNKTFVRQPRIDSSLFISYLGNGHASSFWRITRTSDNFIVYTTAVDVGAAGDTGQKIEFLTPVLDWNETYTVEVRYRDSAGFDSAWSSPVSFTTPVVDQPIFNLPIETSLRPTINLNTVSYDTVNFTHTSTDWQIADDATFNTIIYEALTDTTNLTSLEVPANVVLNSSTNYYVRARINVT